jgi:predicted permease
MPLWPRIRSLAMTIVGGSRPDRDLDEELGAFVDQLAERHVQQGMAPSEARRAALLACGGVEQTKERVRDVRVGAGLDSVLQDVRLGWRGLRRQPGFAAVTIATLALGIGANVGIFSIVRAVLLRPLPYADPSRLVFVWDSTPEQPLENLTPGRLADLRQRATTLSSVAGIAHLPLTLRRGSEAERVLATGVSSNFFEVLGVRAALGRTFRPGGEGPRSVVLSHLAWVRRFAADPAIVGRSIVLDDAPWTVVGVMPATFVWPVITIGASRGPNPDLWIPAPRRDIPALPVTLPGDYAESRQVSYLRAIARLAPGATDAGVARELEVLSRHLSAEHPDSDRVRRFVTVSAAHQMTRFFRWPLVVLLGAVALLLVVACVNVASLLLGRALARRGEMSVRMALGAGRGRLARQFVTEGLVLTSIGAGGGVALAQATLGTLIALGPAGVIRLDEARIDPVVLAFAVGLALASGLVLGVVPLVQLRCDPADALREAGRGLSRGSTRFRSLIVAAEVAVAVALLVGATLLVRSFVALESVDVGIGQPSRVLAFDVFLGGETARQVPLRLAFYDRMLESIRALPGVQSAGAAVTLPIGGDDFGTAVMVEGEPAPEPGREERYGFQLVTPGYFATLGIPVVAGRDLGAGDNAALVNETFARRHWPSGGATGHRIRTGTDNPWMTVVGLVRDVRHLGPAKPARPEIYLPSAQQSFSFMAVVVRSEGDPLALVPSVRRAVSAIDPGQPIANVNTMAGHLRDALAVPRLLAISTGAFAVLSLLLAGLGIHGVMAWSVVQRRREIGTRMAMGASASAIGSAVVRQGAVLVAAGSLAGLFLTVGLGRVLDTLLDNVPPLDGMVVVSILTTVAAVAAVSLWLPANRASRVDPAQVLRE